MRRLIVRGAWLGAALSVPTATCFLIATGFLAPAGAAASAAPVPRDVVPYHFVDPDPPVLALTPGLVGDGFASLLDRLDEAGVVVSLAYPGVGVVMRDHGTVDVALSLESAVTRVLRDPADVDGLARDDSPAARGLFRWWNEGFEDPAVHLERAREAAAERPPVDPDTPVQICAGARTLAEALQERGDGSLLRCDVNDSFGRIHFAAGRIITNVVFPKYVGDAPWTPARLEAAHAYIARSMNWWSLKTGGRATFVVVDFGQVIIPHDPSVLPMADEDVWIADVMQQLGYDWACPYRGLDDMNVASTNAQRGHWAYTQFMLDQSSFTTPGVLAYAYLGGPHTVAMWGNGALGPDGLPHVIAHEMGHIFQALDEYANGCGGCLPRSGYLNAENGNCVNCWRQTGACVMRNAGTYDDDDRMFMESRITPCSWTLGQVGNWDGGWNSQPPNGIIDCMETEPETEILSALPDTLEGSLNAAVNGRGWDQPYQHAPPQYDPPVTINSIRKIEFAIDGSSEWNAARPGDGFWGDREEEWELRLPELGGGHHRLIVRSVNTIGVADPTPSTLDFFVFDVMLRREVEIVSSGARLALIWQIDGEDFGSTYTVYRQRVGTRDMLPVATVPTLTGHDDEFVWWDEGVVPGESYDYRLDVDIPGKGVKTLGLARETAVLADPPPDHFVSIGPNPSRDRVLVTVTVPIGPRGSQSDPPGDGGDPGGIRPSAPAGRDGPDGGGGGPNAPDDPLWRDVRLEVFDVRGRRVADLGVERFLEGRRFNVAWDLTRRDGARVSPGVYFVRATLDYAEDLRKVVVLR